MNERDLPTIKQIVRQADCLNNEPMDDDVAAEWFAQTIRANKERREKKESRDEN